MRFHSETENWCVPKNQSSILPLSEIKAFFGKGEIGEGKGNQLLVYWFEDKMIKILSFKSFLPTQQETQRENNNNTNKKKSLIYLLYIRNGKKNWDK